MSTYVSKDISDALNAARIAAMKKTSRLRVQTGDHSYRVLSLRPTGFSVERDDVPPLRGLVDLFDGARHLYQCLIVASEEVGGEVLYEFKRNTAAADAAPLDFYREPGAPIALIGPSS